MCGIGGLYSIDSRPVSNVERRLAVINSLIEHRGPDGSGDWYGEKARGGLTHRRLAIIDLSEDGAQPMAGENGAVICYNGEIYNYEELRETLSSNWRFRTKSDTESILAAYAKWGTNCVDHLRGMYAFAIWDKDKFFAARDPFGIKPFYYAVVDQVLYFASEIKALLPFLPSIETDADSLAEYLSFQYQIGEKNLFRHVKTLLPGHALKVENGSLRVWRHWDISYQENKSLTAAEAADQLEALLEDSVNVHMKSDVPVGSYVSGGIDSSLVAAMSAGHSKSAGVGFHGKFAEAPDYDESAFARAASDKIGFELDEIVITSDDFKNHFEKVVYHLDQPVAGPGSFPQYMVSELASKKVKVILGGQGGDELFGGYARYMVAYLEQALGHAITGQAGGYNLPLALQSILPNLGVLREYKPLMQQLFRKDLFGQLDKRYFEVINRSSDMGGEVDWNELNLEGVFERYSEIFNSASALPEKSAMDAVTHFDFKCLLPALLQVEDRMSMAHGLEARVPLLDKKIVEFSATLPADIKFPQGRLKDMLKRTAENYLPQKIFDRRDKMGFPVPLKEWYSGQLNEYVKDVFSSQNAKTRPLFNSNEILANFDAGSQFSRKTWALLSLETWQNKFHDKSEQYRSMIHANDIVVPK